MPFGGNRVLFGKPDDTGTFLNDTWIWQRGRWLRIDVPGPPPRAEAAVTYDRRRERVLLFGGYYRAASGTVRLGDTWEWDGQRWIQMAADGPRHVTVRRSPTMHAVNVWCCSEDPVRRQRRGSGTVLDEPGGTQARSQGVSIRR